MRALLCFLALLAAPAAAAPFAVQVGEARIALDAPPGFSDTTFTGSPRLQELAETLTSASNRILLFAITDADMRKFTVGDTPDFKRYMLAVTPRAAERDRIAQPAFQRLVSDSLRDFGKPPPAGDFMQTLEKQQPGVVVLLAELRKDPAIVSVVQGSRLPPTRPDTFFNKEKPQYMLSSTTLMLVRGKALNLSVHTLFESPADADWIRSITERWIDELQRLNNR